MWVKYRHRFAYGTDKKWSYVEIPDDWESYGYSKNDFENLKEDKRLGSFLKNETRIMDENEWSDKYRGIEFEKLDGYPPLEELQYRLERCSKRIDYYWKESIRFAEMISKSIKMGE